MTTAEAYLALERAGISIWSGGDGELIVWPASLLNDELHEVLQEHAVELEAFALQAEDDASAIWVAVSELSGRACRLLRELDPDYWFHGKS